MIALRYIHYSNYQFCTLYTDSYNALQLIQTFPTVQPIVHAILDWLFRIAVHKKTVHFCWVPSHVGVAGNEEVDRLASEAVNTKSEPLSVPATDYYSAFSKCLNSRWQTFWSSITSNKLRTVKTSVTPWLAPCHRNRRWETALARLRIGHTRLPHGFLMDRSTTLCTL